MKLEELSQKCPKCGCVDKTIKRDIEPEHRAQATTEAIVCTRCGYIFESCKGKKSGN